MAVHPDLHQGYVLACQSLGRPENPFIACVLQEADKIRCSKGITLKIAGNNHLEPVQRVTDDDLQVLASVLSNTVFVTGLDLRYNALTDAAAKHVAAFLQENSTLRYLNLMFNDIGTSGAELIARALHRNETLVYLRMTGNKIGNKGGMFFASMLQINSTLEKLDLGDCDMGTQSLIATATALTQNKSVKAINLNRPLLYSQEEETTVHVALMLKKNSSLVELHLCKHEMKNFGVERLCEALYENSSLKYLDLSCNEITRDGVKFLAELLKRNQTLEILDLNANRMEDDGAIYLSEALALNNRTLQALSVVSNNISGKGLTALADAMKANMELSYIYIWGNKFDEATCIAFSELIETGRLKPNRTDVEPYEVEGHVHLAELSYGLKKHYYWTPSCGEGTNRDANASLAVTAVSEHL
ncbi:PREDICTED: leucine-rich repeat-containing protein 34 isoform X1 [Calidris pugnax]|uniref:leucine-rich repeat-containing protein 34 isoform X1 n=1 Tax=Calidris pugnax TaxID=198806 RepID=UPI00071D77D7|nr:PREDICTED: leucine-rich repeat-containing protein 34 isoform X1 [Calidris pugnax]XP_014794266.1 PREDICTED: leucine-rich repeat-containing protein 34 isoform X1 [Calidris pugnax]